MIQEAIIRDSEDATKASIWMCRTCKSCKAVNTQPGPILEIEQADRDFIVTPLSEEKLDDMYDRTDPVTYYTPDAPVNSIAKGKDYGRILHDVLPVPSTLEKMILAEGRCYSVTVKIVVRGNVTERKKLRGNTICFPQTYESVTSSSFSSATITAALTGINIVFVGPKSERSRMERAALLIDDLVLRPEVLWNHYHIKYRLHGGPPPPTAEEIVDVIKNFSLPAHVKKYARSYEDTSLEPVISDINNVRSHAQEERDNVRDDVAVAQQNEAEDLAPSLIHIGVMPNREIGILHAPELIPHT